MSEVNYAVLVLSLRFSYVKPSDGVVVAILTRIQTHFPLQMTTVVVVVVLKNWKKEYTHYYAEVRALMCLKRAAERCAVRAQTCIMWFSKGSLHFSGCLSVCVCVCVCACVCKLVWVFS